MTRAASQGVLGALFGLLACSSAAFAQSDPIQQQYLPPPNLPASTGPP